MQLTDLHDERAFYAVHSYSLASQGLFVVVC